MRQTCLSTQEHSSDAKSLLEVHARRTDQKQGVFGSREVQMLDEERTSLPESEMESKEKCTSRSIRCISSFLPSFFPLVLPDLLLISEDESHTV